MPRKRDSRSRSRRYRQSRDKSRSKSRNRLRHRSSPEPRSRSRYNSRRRSCSRTRRHTDRDRSQPRLGSKSPRPSANFDQTLDTIMSRLKSIENNLASTPIQSENVPSSAQAIVDAIHSIIPGRSQNYYISNFDPSIHDIDAWCSEVDRAQVANLWDDRECLSRVAGCLKGDARVWLNEWVTDDRSWSSFKREFRPLCPRRLDYAGILFDVLSTNSDKYSSYSEYARRALLRLRIVKGLSEELMTLIVIRGINDAQVKPSS